MKVHKIELMVVDVKQQDIAKIKDLIEALNPRYYRVTKTRTKDIGEWFELHPLNDKSTQIEYCKKLFSEKDKHDEED